MTQQKNIMPGILCCFSYDHTTKSNDRKDMFVDDSFVPMYDMEISVYHLNADKKYNHGKRRLHVPTARFLYVKRHDKPPDPLLDEGWGDGWRFDSPLDHGHIVLVDDQLVLISDISLYYMNIYVTPVLA